MKRGLLLGLFAVALGAGLLRAAEVEETMQSAYQAFLEGRLDDAVKAYRYLATLGATLPEPDANLALLNRDQADQDQSLALWVKSSLLDGADGFVWNQRGWSYLGEDRPKDAKDSFTKAIDRSSTTASQGEANIGLGLASIANGQPKAGLAPLRTALQQGPFVIPAASFVAGLDALSMGDKGTAMAYFAQSVQLDPANLEALRELAHVHEKVGENRPAWHLYHRILALDPDDAEAGERSKKLAQFIPGDPTTSLALRRMSRPLLTPDMANARIAGSSVPLRVGLFSGRDGRPETAVRMYLMVNSDFRLLAGKEAVNENGRAFDQWSVEFRPESGVVEVRDTSRNIQYTAKQPFRVVPAAAQGSVLVKSAQFTKDYGFDAGDVELRGVLEIIPTPDGFRLVNELDIEEYVAGAVGAALPTASPKEAFKAQAVVSRSLALWYKSQSAANPERADICDSPRCQRYAGVSGEGPDSRAAAAATIGQVLITPDGRLAHVMEHENCGGRTESGSSTDDVSLKALVSIDDAPSAAARPKSPIEFERWLHDPPPRDRYCEAGSVTAPSESRWMRVLDAKVLKARAERVKFVGPLKRLRVVRRSETGRVQALEVVGTRGSFVLEGSRAIGDFLSPGSLRSTLFTIQPLMKGAAADRFILWGAGTGHGLGLCRAGAIGQASLGRGWRAILGVYFPGLAVEDLHAKPKPPKPAQPLEKPTRGKPRNPHWKPK